MLLVVISGLVYDVIQVFVMAWIDLLTSLVNTETQRIVLYSYGLLMGSIGSFCLPKILHNVLYLITYL